jgi:hypothetical protein
MPMPTFVYSWRLVPEQITSAMFATVVDASTTIKQKAPKVVRHVSNRFVSEQDLRFRNT